MESANSPDVLLIGAEWPQRALLRAELIEAGFQVAAIDAWPIPGRYLRTGMTPRVAIVDLRGLPEPRVVLDELPFVLPPDQVLVITALGTVPVTDIRRMGYHAIGRPTTVHDVVAGVARLLRTHSNTRPPVGVGR